MSLPNLREIDKSAYINFKTVKGLEMYTLFGYWLDFLTFFTAQVTENKRLEKYASLVSHSLI